MEVVLLCLGVGCCCHDAFCGIVLLLSALFFLMPLSRKQCVLDKCGFALACSAVAVGLTTAHHLLPPVLYVVALHCAGHAVHAPLTFPVPFVCCHHPYISCRPSRCCCCCRPISRPCGAAATK